MGCKCSNKGPADKLDQVENFHIRKKSIWQRIQSILSNGQNSGLFWLAYIIFVVYQRNESTSWKHWKVLNQLQGTIKSIKTAGLVQALYKLGGMRPFLIIYASSLEYKPEELVNQKLQCQSLFILLSAVRLDLSFSTDFVRLRKYDEFFWWNIIYIMLRCSYRS